jgi:hypothetical protein
VTVLETDTRLRVARGVEKNEADATLHALKTLAQRNGMGHPPPLASDGHNGCAEAMVDTWGKVPLREKGPGRPPQKKSVARLAAFESGQKPPGKAAFGSTAQSR